MGYEYHLVRHDNQTLYELGKTRGGLHMVFLELRTLRTDELVLPLGSEAELAGLLLEAILENHWEQPADYETFVRQLAPRIVRWGGEQPLKCLGESEREFTHACYRQRYTTTDSRYEGEWPYYDVFSTLDPQVRRLIEHPPSWFNGAHRRYSIAGWTRAEDRAQFCAEMRALPVVPVCDLDVLGCTLGSAPHDHSTSMPTSHYCSCECHAGAPVFCSCWTPCCHEPGTPKPRQTPRRR